MRLLATVTPFLRRHGVWVSPQTTFYCPGCILCGCVCLGLGSRSFTGVLFEMPRHCQLNLAEIAVDATDRYFAHGAPVTIRFVTFHRDTFSKRTIRQRTLRRSAKGLTALRRVDAGEANFVLMFQRIEHGEGVTVGHTDDATNDRLGDHDARQGNKGDEQR